MNQGMLLMELSEEEEEAAREPVASGQVRMRRPVRNQVEMIARDLDSMVADNHPVRTVWEFLSKLDLSAFYSSIKTALDRPGRPASDPQVLLALWVYATAEGIGSARRLARLSEEHDVYRWLRGGIPVDYHLLAEFRVSHQKAMDDLITQILAVLLKAKVVDLKRVSQDGMRVRASAGQASFRREKSLKECLSEAQEQVKEVAEQRDLEASERERAARERAVRERQERVEHALRQLPEVQAVKERQRKNAGKKRAAKVQQARVSTTDPVARRMKMADGGFRPGYNVQFATDTHTQVIAGVAVNNHGTDQGEALPVEEQVVWRGGRHPDDYLIDGGFVALKDIETLERNGVKVYAPPKDSGEIGVERRAPETPEVTAWRERMKTEEAKEIYKERAATAECVNALMRARYGLKQFTVRGLPKVLCVTLLLVVTHNLLRWITLTS
ncbi:MAG: IS1182 family transposase [Chloroflexi bacterium]|nr:IS1182 family transposase [Chloroflexota bacterium]